MDDDVSDNDYNDEVLSDFQDEFVNNVVLRRKSGSTAIKRRYFLLNYHFLFWSIIFIKISEQED